MNNVQFKHLCSVDSILDWALTILQDLIMDLPKDDENRIYLACCYEYLSKYWQRISACKHKEVKFHEV